MVDIWVPKLLQPTHVWKTARAFQGEDQSTQRRVVHQDTELSLQVPHCEAPFRAAFIVVSITCNTRTTCSAERPITAAIWQDLLIGRDCCPLGTRDLHLVSFATVAELPAPRGCGCLISYRLASGG